MAEIILPKLLKMTLSIDLNARHGSILAIGEVLLALSNICAAAGSNVASKLSSDMLAEVRNLVARYRERLFFRGLGGELMKQACAFYIQKCSQAHLPFHDENVIG